MLSILMPVYNERERVERAIAEVLETELPGRVRADHRRRRLHRRDARDPARRASWDERVRLFEHEHNQGKGAAIQTALAQARGDFAAIFDADLEYDPADLGAADAAAARRARQRLLRRPRVRRLHEPLVPVRAGQQGRHAGLQRALQRVPARHHDLPQDDPDRHVPQPAAALGRVRDRARDHRPAGPARRADLRGAGPLPRPGHRRGQEAHRAGRLPRDRDAAALPLLPPASAAVA